MQVDREALRRVSSRIATQLTHAGPGVELLPCVSLMEIAMMFGWVWSTAYSLSSKGILPDPDFTLGSHPMWKLPTIYRWASGSNPSGTVREIVWDPWGIVAPAQPAPPRPERPTRSKTR